MFEILACLSSYTYPYSCSHLSVSGLAVVCNQGDPELCPLYSTRLSYSTHVLPPKREFNTMLAAATSFFARTNISQSYNIGQPPSGGSASSSRPTTPGVSSSSANSPSGSGSNGIIPTTFTPTFPVGLWKVQSAYHKVTNKRVSVWSFDKRSADMERLGVLAKERTLEVLKAEVSLSFNLSRQ